MSDVKRVDRIVAHRLDRKLHKVVGGVPGDSNRLHLSGQWSGDYAMTAGNGKCQPRSSWSAGGGKNICDFIVIEEEESELRLRGVHGRVEPHQCHTDAIEGPEISGTLIQRPLVGNGHGYPPFLSKRRRRRSST